MQQRRRAFAKAHRSEADRLEYIAASRHASSVVAKAKSRTWQSTCSDLSPRSNPRAVFSLLRSVSGNSKSSSSSPDFPDSHSPSDTANCYASHLRSHLSVPTPKSCRSRARFYMNSLRSAECPPSPHSSFCSPFTLHELSEATSRLSSSTACGPDGIAYPLLRHLPQISKELLLQIFNRSWLTQTFPSPWKPSVIIPIHKAGKPRTSPASYRPISLTSCISKLFERLILARLTFFLESSNLLSTCQAGFRPGRSTLDQILLLSQSIWDGFQLKPPHRTILASIDFSKAFDSVWHPALFHKLQAIGLPPCFIRWTRSFLADRRAKVRFEGAQSRSFRIRRGVPQGSVLGPALFILFVNDIPQALPPGTKASLYADDLALWSSSPSLPQANTVTQSALSKLEEWSAYWRLPLNPTKCESSLFTTDTHQAQLQPSLVLQGTPLQFNPCPKFLGVTFNRTLSFGDHIHSLKAKFFPRLKALRSIASATWGPSKESLTILYKAFVRPVLSYASPGWYPFLCDTNSSNLEVLHRAACRAITGCLSSTPIPLLQLEALLPPLSVTLSHQALSFYERALRLPPAFPIGSLASTSVKKRLKHPSWRSFCLSHGLPPPSAPREPLVHCPPFAPWFPPNFEVTAHIPNCSRSDPSDRRQASAESHLDSLPPVDVYIWTDGSVPTNFGPGGAGIYALCTKCSSTISLSYSSGPVSSSFTAEISALRHGLEWCKLHHTTCHFSSALFLTDSQSALTLLSTSPSLLLPKPIWDVWNLVSSLSLSIEISFQWIPGHSSLPGNEKADSLARTGASLPTEQVPCALGPLTASLRHSLFSHWRRSIKNDYLHCQIPSISPEELVLPRSVRCALSRLRCHGHSLLLSSYLFRIGRAETPSCSACGHSPQDLPHLLLDCPESERLRRAIFGTSLSFLDMWSRPWGVARLLSLRGVPPRPHPPEGVG